MCVFYVYLCFMHKIGKNFSCSLNNFWEYMPYINWTPDTRILSFHCALALDFVPGRCSVCEGDLSCRPASLLLLSFLTSRDLELLCISVTPSFHSHMYPGLRDWLCGHPIIASEWRGPGYFWDLSISSLRLALCFRQQKYLVLRLAQLGP